ncbi:MAG: mshD [Microbacteriaceae bacterium]|nr:mshD [Microbacteriaceae bacterium]
MPQQSAPDAGLISRARAADGQPPFSDQSLVDLRQGARTLIAVESAAAIVGQGEAEFVVDPDARGHGIGTAMLERILAGTTGDLLVWAHGDHPAARALAASHGLEPVRTLLQLEKRRIELVEISPTKHAGEVSTSSTRFSAFHVGRDEQAWVTLNARIFSFHAEQGSVTVDDVLQLETEEWFDAGDFLVAWDGDTMVGYCWLKIEDGTGEIYVIGVAPEQQGTGLGRTLMAAGYARLAERGIRTVHLYVEGDNEKALALYRSLGFTDRSVDIQYLLRR